MNLNVNLTTNMDSGLLGHPGLDSGLLGPLGLDSGLRWILGSWGFLGWILDSGASWAGFWPSRCIYEIPRYMEPRRHLVEQLTN